VHRRGVVSAAVDASSGVARPAASGRTKRPPVRTGCALGQRARRPVRRFFLL